MAPTYRYDPTASRHVFERDLGYLHGVARNAERFASQPALSEAGGGRSWTYAELWRDVEQLAGAFSSRGVVAGEAIVFQLFNGPEFALCWLAAMRLGAVAVPINFRLSAGETAHILEDSTPTAYLVDRELTETAAAALDLADHEPHLTVIVGAGKSSMGTDFEEMTTTQAAVPDWPRVDLYAETTRLYTSGTTGMPKGVSLNGLIELMSAHDVIMHFPLGPYDRTLNMTPWFHRGGLYAGGPNPALYVGAEAVALRAFDPALVLDLVAERGLSFLIGAPTNLALLADEQERSRRSLESLRGIVTMGAPLERVSCLRYQEVLTPRIFNGYGTTETFWNTFLRPEDLPAHAGSAGRSCTDDDVVVAAVGDSGAEAANPVARDGIGIGEVLIRSPKCGYAYVNRPDDQEERFRDGWFHTGDLASWDAEGFLTVVGRKDDMLISGGENVHPVQVEEVLNSHEHVADSAVVGLPDSRWGELIVAYVVRSSEELDAEDLDRHCRADAMLANYKRPRAYRFVEDLPMTATGKKLLFKVREQAIADDEAGLIQRVGIAR